VQYYFYYRARNLLCEEKITIAEPKPINCKPKNMADIFDRGTGIA